MANSVQPVATQHVLINNSRIAHGVHGPSNGTPLVLVHGTPSSSLIFRKVIPVLTSANFKVHLFDLLGFGLSERPLNDSVDTSMTGQVSVLLGLLEHWGLGGEEVHLVAHDIGGGVAQRFAAFHGNRLRSLTMIDCVSFDSYPSKRTKEQMASGLENLIKASDSDHQSHFREWLLSAVHHKDQFSSSSLPTFLSYISGPIGQASLFEHQIKHYDPKHTLEVVPKLGEIGKAMPVQLIWGKEDEWQVLDWAKKLNAAIEGSELSVVEEAGHFSLEDQPQKIGELIVDFIGRKGR